MILLPGPQDVNKYVTRVMVSLAKCAEVHYRLREGTKMIHVDRLYKVGLLSGYR